MLVGWVWQNAAMRRAGAWCLFFPLAANLLGQADPTVPWDLQRAGTNRTAWEQALRDVPQAQRKTLEFLMRQMPDHDASSLDAAFLLQQVELAHRARAAVPLGSALDDAMFLGFVVPYAQGNERRED